MKLAVVVLYVAVVVVSVSSQSNSQVDYFVDSMLSNPTVVRQQIDCVLRRGSCDFIGMRLMAALPEVINGNCRSCNPEQQAIARRITSFIQQNYPQDWQAIQALYGRSG